jgi:hypothetical protein
LVHQDEASELPDQPDQPGREMSRVKRFADDLGSGAIGALAWVGLEHAVNAFAPGAGLAVRAVHLIGQVARAAKSFVEGDGVKYQVPVATMGDISLNIEFTLCQNDPPPLLPTTVSVDFADGLAPDDAPSVDGATSDTHRAAGREWYDKVQPEVQRVNVFAEYVVRCVAPSGPAVTVPFQAESGTGRIVIETDQGSYTPVTFEIRGTCTRCGRDARRDASVQHHCEHCT